MKELIKKYVDVFNAQDREYYKQDIDNAHAAAWMEENVPLIEIPDKTLEQIYYFRWWVFRKHIKSTEDGYVLTEFLPPVPWGGKHNTIIAAVGHHLAEGKWLRGSQRIIEEYAKFFLEEKSNTYLYSSWILYAVYEYCAHVHDFSFGIEHLDLLVNYYETVEREHMTACGLFWSIDNNDAMECSISGVSETFETQRGLRPTLNSYMAANAWAVSEFAKMAGRAELSDLYREKYERIKQKMTEILWDGGFYKAIHHEDLDHPSRERVPPAQDARELIGYIPWCFCLPPEGFDGAFALLKTEEGFCAPHGLSTAERAHPRYLYEYSHECLWNGYVWPFATSQTLTAVKNLLNCYEQKTLTDADFYAILRTYAQGHFRTEEDGTEVCWIDEVKHPITGDWSSRTVLEQWGWRKELGGFERGKDYNHSTFCDLVLGGLLGIESKNGEITVRPHIPQDWNWFSVDNLCIKDACYKILYDRNGDRYGYGKGITVLKK